MQPEKQTKHFWYGLAVLVMIYSAYFLLFVENKKIFDSVARQTKYIMAVLVVFAVYLSGSFFLRKLPQAWLLVIWHMVHITLISLVLVLWGWHIIYPPLPMNLKKLSHSLHEFLISPLLFVATYLLSRTTVATQKFT